MTDTGVRSKILDAAEAIVQARGVPALTLEAAARDAAVSKGGLLYHFGTKEQLLQALLQRLASFIDAEFRAVVESQAPGRHRAARAALAWAVDEAPFFEGRYDRAAAVFLAAHHHDPSLLDPMRAVFAAMKQRMLDEGTPPGPALAIMAAGDGLFMAHVFRTWSASPAERAALRVTLGSLLEETP